MGSPVLTCTGTCCPSGLCFIQRKMGAGWSITRGKGILFPLLCVVPQPPICGSTDPETPWIYDHNFAGTNLSSLCNAAQATDRGPCNDAQPVPLPAQAWFVLPRPQMASFLSLFCVPATLSHALCWPTQHGTNSPTQALDAASRSQWVFVRWLSLLQRRRQHVLQHVHVIPKAVLGG